jgi:hypothetical protein
MSGVMELLLVLQMMNLARRRIRKGGGRQGGMWIVKMI